MIMSTPSPLNTVRINLYTASMSLRDLGLLNLYPFIAMFQVGIVAQG